MKRHAPRLLAIYLVISLLGLSMLFPFSSARVNSSSIEAGVTVALTISDISASSIRYYRTTISWKTNGDATSQVFYDTTSHDNITDYAHYIDEATNLVSEHSITLTGLSSSTTYHYRVRSVAIVDSTEFIATSEDYTFTTSTPAEGDGGAPPPAPSPAPPAPPPGTTDVSDIVTTNGVFTEEVVAASADGTCELTIDEGTRGLTKDKEPLSQITVVEMEVPPPPPEDAYTIGLVYDFGPDGATFDPPITLTLTYDPYLIAEGAAEENLVVAYYDEDAEKWVELDSIVDAEANTISAKVSHFAVFAVFGYEVAVPPVIPPVPPAAFTVSHLSISPSEVYIGERVSIRLIVANTGGESGSYKVTLKINGVVEATKEVTVYAGLSKEITFTISKDIAGTYSVAVDGLTGSFIVKEELVPEAPEIPPVFPEPFNPWLIGGITAGVIVVGLGILFLIRRRALRSRIRC